MDDFLSDYQKAVIAIDSLPVSYNEKSRALRELDQWKTQQMKGQIATELSGPRFEPLETPIGTLPVTGATYNAKLGQYIPAYTETPDESAFKNRGQLLEELKQSAATFSVPDAIVGKSGQPTYRAAKPEEILSSSLRYDAEGNPFISLGVLTDEDGNVIKEPLIGPNGKPVTEMKDGKEVPVQIAKERTTSFSPDTYRKFFENAAAIRGEESPWVAKERELRAGEENKRALEQFSKTATPFDPVPVFQPQAKIDSFGRVIPPKATDYVVNRALMNQLPDQLAISRAVEQPFVNKNEGETEEEMLQRELAHIELRKGLIQKAANTPGNIPGAVGDILGNIRTTGQALRTGIEQNPGQFASDLGQSAGNIIGDTLTLVPRALQTSGDFIVNQAGNLGRIALNSITGASREQEIRNRLAEIQGKVKKPTAADVAQAVAQLGLVGKPSSQFTEAEKRAVAQWLQKNNFAVQ